MANKEQLAILKQGVAAWNKWREENPDVKIDLREARFDGINLSGANFHKAGIRGASFRGAILAQAIFSNSNAGYLLIGSGIQAFMFFMSTGYVFSMVLLLLILSVNTNYYRNDNLYIIYFIFFYGIITICVIIWYIAVRSFTDFREADLTGAFFNNSDLKHTNFNNAILTGTSFVNAKGLQHSRRKHTIIEDYDVQELIVNGKARGLFLKGKNLKGAYIANADLRDLDFRETDFRQANLSGADITGAKLWGTSRDNWIIDGIRCEYVYWDEAGEVRTPPDRDFRPGEFEELYKQLPSFEYIFANGVTPLDMLIMDRVVQAINEQHKEFSLELVNFDKRGQPHATFTVCRLDYVDAARKQIEEGYEKNRIAPEQQEQLMAAVLGLIENQNKLIDKIPSPRELTMGDIYNINGGQIGAIGQHASASGNTFQQITAELSSLHEVMRTAAANPAQNAAADEVAKAEQAAKQQDEPKMRQHLKKAGKFAVDCVQKIGAEALSEYLKKMTLGM